MSGARMERVAEQLRRVLSEILLYKVRDPEVHSAVITRVDVSRDLGHARVHVSVLGTDEDREQTMRALGRASSFVRAELARAVRLRKVPELRFHPDTGIEHSSRIQESLRQLGLDGGEGGRSAGEDARGTDAGADPGNPDMGSSGSGEAGEEDDAAGGWE